MSVVKDLSVIGRAERIDLVDLDIESVPAKIDTGADASSIWAHAVEVKDNVLHVIFFAENSAFYTGTEHMFGPDEYVMTRVANSFGHREVRYKIKLQIRIKKRLINATFTLANRSEKLYPILIGRRLLAGKFVVDVTKGSPLKAAEDERSKRLAKDMEILNGKAEL